MTEANRPQIIVADDDPEMREWLENLLEKEGYEVLLLPSGLDLAQSIASLPNLPNLIVLDVMMSWIGGFELCRALKANPLFAEIPIVFVSGKSAQNDIQEGMEAGAIGYFPKPIDSHSFLTKIREIVPR